jgi:hypothetical protein
MVMPNYCINKVKVSSSDKEELTRFKENVLDEGFDFEKIIPYPIDAPLEAKEEHEKKNDITHQNEWTQWYNDKGYHWCSEAWGTKWNRIGLKINKLKSGYKLNFDSAWCPPYGIYMRLRNKYPKLDFTWVYLMEEDGYEEKYLLNDKEALEYDEVRKETLDKITNGEFTLTLKEQN